MSKFKARGSVEAGNEQFPKSVVMAKVRVEPDRHERYMKAFERLCRSNPDMTFAACTRQALDAWADRILA